MIPGILNSKIVKMRDFYKQYHPDQNLRSYYNPADGNVGRRIRISDTYNSSITIGASMPNPYYRDYQRKRY